MEGERVGEGREGSEEEREEREEKERGGEREGGILHADVRSLSIPRGVVRKRNTELEKSWMTAVRKGVRLVDVAILRECLNRDHVVNPPMLHPVQAAPVLHPQRSRALSRLPRRRLARICTWLIYVVCRSSFLAP